jgi:4-diphosphocytidyl-2-C-methyl-D-erythritol kinase
VGAGLGGGSSDAAAVLLAAEAVWQVQATPEERRALAAGLGSDVPFFLVGGTAAASGRGERVEPLPPAPAIWLVVGKPAESVSTAAAYQRFDALPAPRRTASLPMRAALARGDLAGIAGLLYNDLEAAVLPVAPETARLERDLLAAGCLGALMTGSGSAAFGVARDEAHAQAVAGDLAGRYPWVRAVRTSPESCRIAPCGKASERSHA